MEMTIYEALGSIAQRLSEIPIAGYEDRCKMAGCETDLRAILDWLRKEEEKANGNAHTEPKS